jgi:antitoxin component of MazEF toxin-antitoxin module
MIMMNPAMPARKVRTRKQGNAITVTIPKAFNVKAGTTLEAKVTDKGILFEYPKKQPQTIEELFADYKGGSFKTELIDLGESVGNEKW